MTLETTRFGPVEVDPDSIITFTQPIIGFQEYRRYVLMPGPPNGAVKWLQSADNGELAFIVMDPRCVRPDYTVTPSPHDLAELRAASGADLEVYTLVVVPEDPTQVRTNLRAPILINPTHRLGKQTILDGSEYPIQLFLAQARGRAKAHQEVANARADA